MCGRFVLYDVEGIKKKFNIEIKPSFNIAPSQQVLIYDKKPHFMKWSFSPIWAKKDFNLINCRSETMYEKPSFKNTERCVFVLNGALKQNRPETIRTEFKISFCQPNLSN